MLTIKTHEQYTVAQGNYMVVVSIDLTKDTPRITLSKPDGFNGRGGRDYHFELSQIEAVEQFAKCALEAVKIARSLMPPKKKSKNK